MQIRFTPLVMASLLAAPAFAQQTATPPSGGNHSETQPFRYDGLIAPGPHLPLERIPTPLDLHQRPQSSNCIRLLNQSGPGCSVENFPTPVYKPAEPAAPCAKTDTDGKPDGCLYLLEK